MDHSDKEISLALLYCRCSDGALCNVCPYAKYAPNCSNLLLQDASNRIKELSKEGDHEDDQQSAAAR